MDRQPIHPDLLTGSLNPFPRPPSPPMYLSDWRGEIFEHASYAESGEPTIRSFLLASVALAAALSTSTKIWATAGSAMILLYLKRLYATMYDVGTNLPQLNLRCYFWRSSVAWKPQEARTLSLTGEFPAAKHGSHSCLASFVQSPGTCDTLSGSSECG